MTSRAYGKTKNRGNLQIRKLKPLPNQPQQYAVRFRYKNADDKWVWSTTDTRDAENDTQAWQQAQNYFNEFENDSMALDITANKKKRLNVSQLIELYKEQRIVQVSVGSIKQRTVDSESHLYNTIDHYLGDKIFSNIRPDHIEQFYTQMALDGVSPDKRPKVHDKLNLLFKFGLRKGYRSNNPIDLMDERLIPRKPKKNPLKQSTKRFTESEAMDFITKLRLDFDNEPTGHKMLLLIAFYTGMRRGEIMGLKWEDIKTNDSGVLFFSVSKALQPDHSLDDPKTQTSIRYVPIGQTLAYYLNIWKTAQRKQFEENGITTYQDENGNQVTLKGKHGKNLKGFKRIKGAKHTQADDDFICTNSNGEVLGYYTYDRWRKRYLVSLKYEYDLLPDGEVYKLVHKQTPEGKPYIVPTKEKETLAKDLPNVHALRKLYASVLHRQNIPGKEIQSALGHSSMRTTEDFYIYPEDDLNTKLSDVIDSRFFNQPVGNPDGYLNDVMKAEGITAKADNAKPHPELMSKEEYVKEFLPDLNES